MKRISENTELICSHLTFSYVKKPSTKLLAFPCKCIHLLRQSPLPRYLRILHQPTRLVRGSGWSPRWMTSPNLCRSHWVGVSWDGRGSECVSPACWLCSCLDVEEKGSANTVWLCCFLVDSALNFIRRFKYVSLSQPAAVVWWRYCVSPADAPREDQLHILFLFGLSYSRASISDGNFLAEPFSRLLQHQCLVGADKVWSSALHHRVEEAWIVGILTPLLGIKYRVLETQSPFLSNSESLLLSRSHWLSGLELYSIWDLLCCQLW